MKKLYPVLILFVVVLSGLIVLLKHDNLVDYTIGDDLTKIPSSKKIGIQNNTDKPGEFLKYFQQISTPIGHTKSGYPPNYRHAEFKKAFSAVKGKNGDALRLTSGVTEVISRGPGNVGGRTRAIVIDADDTSHETWFAGATSGGIWKTTDAGASWTNLTPDLPNLSIGSLAMSASNTDVMYAGTGELPAGNYSFVRGDGVFKSIDKGVNWTQLAATAGNSEYNSVNRIAIDPSDENIVVICTNTGIYKTIDGGTTWTQKYSSNGNSVQDLQVDPTDFATQYAGVNSVGIIKSTDSGETWVKSSDGIADGERFEIAIAPSNTNKVYTSTYNPDDETLLYVSSDKGATWSLFHEENNANDDFLYEQGWYDNTIAVHPYDEDIIYVGGVALGQFEITGATSTSAPQFLGVDQENTSFLAFVNFGQEFFGGALAIGDGGDLEMPSEEFHNVEVRFGAGFSQKAHRFEVPSDGGTNGDGGAGIPDADFTYQDYVDVPFEVWDIDENKQLMVSFRDQQADGEFNLNPRDDDNDPNLLTAREYLFIHNIEYSATPHVGDNGDDGISTLSMGHMLQNMYFFWPLLADGATWGPGEDPAVDLPTSILRIKYGSIDLIDGKAQIVSDPRSDFVGGDDNLHADHHHLTMIPINQGTNDFRIVNGNDGGLGYSDDSGATWTQILDGYVTTQFYGADKKPGADEYFGGMQDNGTWQSPIGENASSTSDYNERLGGDGFEVLWHATDPDKMMGSIYNNQIYKSTNGGVSWTSAQSGINTAEGPFITRLASSKTSPDEVFAVSATGVLKTNDFGGSWDLTAISVEDGWTFDNGGPVATSQHDVEVSLANDDVIWAGYGMHEGNNYNIFVSTDGGESFEAVSRYTGESLGVISGMATHPTDANTAYLLFSYASRPKILKTTDLGETWADISGFEGNSVSSNGFPDVLVHSLLVMPHDTDIIWAGTEIGLFESLDGGATWAYADIGLPAVSIWTMKVVDDEVVFGTHGRGIWTATIPELLNTQSVVTETEYIGQQTLKITAKIAADFDKVEVYVDDQLAATENTVTKGTLTVEVAKLTEEASSVYLIAYLGADSYQSPAVTSVEADFKPILNSMVSNSAEELLFDVGVNENYSKLEVYLDDELVSTVNSTTIGSNEITVSGLDGGKLYAGYVVGYIDSNGYQSTTINAEVIAGFISYFYTEEMKVYPNPSINEVSIEISGINNVQNARIELFDMTGKMVAGINPTIDKNTFRIDVSDYERGMYILNVVGEDKIYTQKINLVR